VIFPAEELTLVMMTTVGPFRALIVVDFEATPSMW